MKLDAALSLALGFFLAVSGALVALSLAREARATSFGSLTESLDARAARGLADVELYRALRDATPPEAAVFFLGDPAEVAAHLAFSQTEPLVFPRRFYRVEGLPQDFTPRAGGLDARSHVVTYGALRELDLSEWFEPLVDGARFRLWRLRPDTAGEGDER